MATHASLQGHAPTHAGLHAGALRKDTSPAKLLQHLQHHHEHRIPVSGRLLNSVPGGYAVGVAGFVGFCPYAACSLAVASRVGLLQPFLIDHLDPAQMGQFRLVDLKVAERQRQGDEASKGPDYRQQPIAQDLQVPWPGRKPPREPSEGLAVSDVVTAGTG